MISEDLRLGKTIIQLMARKYYVGEMSALARRQVHRQPPRHFRGQGPSLRDGNQTYRPNVPTQLLFGAIKRLGPATFPSTGLASLLWSRSGLAS